MTIVDNDTAGVSMVPDTGLSFGGGRRSVTYTIVLDSQPTEPVTVTIVNPDDGVVMVMPDTLTFTPTDWNMPQMVTVSAVDGIDTNDVMIDLSHTVTSGDGDYEGFTAEDVNVARPPRTPSGSGGGGGSVSGGGGSVSGGGGGRSVGEGIVIIANGWSASDIGVAASLAASTPDAAVLYTAPSGLPDEVAELLGQYRPERVIVIGGEGAVSALVLREARRASRGSKLERFSGVTRADTAASVARRVFGDAAVSKSRTLIVANGWSSPDIGVAASLAARTRGAAVAYTSADKLPQAALDLIAEYKPSRIIIVGGTAAVTPAVAEAITAAAPESAIERITGATRVDTAAVAARRVLGGPGGAGSRTLVIANGWSPPDIGTAASLVARTRGSAVVFTLGDTLSQAAHDLIAEYKPSRIIIVGGTAAVISQVGAEITATVPQSRIERITGATRTVTAELAARKILPPPEF